MMLQIGTPAASQFPVYPDPDPEVDSHYIKTYGPELITRFYFSQKYTAIVLEGKEEVPDLRYRPNTTINMGVGFTYRSLTLNLAYGFPFLNRDKGRGDTRYLDLQSHIYTRNWTMDFFGQLYKGYFLLPKGTAIPDNDKYYVRPDIGVSLFGLAVYQLQNGRKFSYRAAMVQSEWQQKSAGTWLLGGEIYVGSFSADSNFVPGLLSMNYPQRDVRKVRFIEAGPGAGYAYTVVMARNWFITGSATLNLDVGLTREFRNGGTSDKFSISPNFIYRGVAGYNSDRWVASLTMVGNRVTVRGASSNQRYLFNTGNYRVTLARRFLPGPRLKPKLKWLDPK